MDIFAFIHTSDPTKVKVVKRERKEDEPRLLKTTVGRTVPLLPVAPDLGESKLDASVDKLFDEDGSGVQTEQGDFTSGGGEQGINIQPVTETTDIVAEDVIPLGEPILTLPFVTSSVSATPEREGEGHTDSVTRLNLRTISAPQRFVISLDSSYHSGANIAEAEVDSFARPSVPVITAATTITSTADPDVVVKEKIVKPSLFADDSTSAGETDPAMAGFMDLTGSDFLLFTEFNVGAARQMSLSAEVRMRAEYNIRKKRRLKSVVEEKDQLLKARDEEIKDLKAQMLLKEVEATKAIRLHAKASNFETVEKSLWDKVNALNERNIILKKERNALDVKVTDLEAVVVHELQVSSSGLKEKLFNYENLTEWLEEFLDAQLKDVNDKFDKLYTDFMEMTLHLKERFYTHLLTTIAGRKWLLIYRMKLAIAKCLNSPEYLSALGTAISKAIEKGMQDGLAAGITHGKEGRVLTDVAAHNPFAEVDYVSALQQLQGVNFPLLAEFKSNKDASIKALMNILPLEEHLAERLGLNESQPHVDQLMVPIYHSPDKTVVGVSALSLALDVSDARVRRIRENIVSHRSLFQDVFIALVGPLSAAAVTCTKGTSDDVPTTADTTTALSVTFAFASIVNPISIDDDEVIGTDDQSVANENVVDENANPFLNVDDSELNIP
nr:hypothetical protein [Tanacetum cinerariifolium]